MTSIKELFQMIAEFIGNDATHFKFLIIIIVVVTLFYKYLIAFLKFRIILYSTRHETELNEYYTVRDMKIYTKYYINTRFQNTNPADHEFESKFMAISSSSLVSIFDRDILSGNVKYKYNLILADTGMGKTAFLINIYLKQLRRLKFLKWVYYNKINYIPLWAPNVNNKISEIKDKRRTVLLLDAFDEDPMATIDPDERIKEISKLTSEFKCIVITARTQFFISGKEQFSQLGIFTGGETGQDSFHIVFLTPFSLKESKKYLKKIYPIYKFRERNKAYNFIKNQPAISLRPMLLANIKDIFGPPYLPLTTRDVYDRLINKWFERESNKPSALKTYSDRMYYINKLMTFTKLLAFNIYSKAKERGGYFISLDEIKMAENLKYSELSDIFESTDVDSLTVRSKSVLTRNTKGDVRFSHKSFLEYFLYLYLFENPEKIAHIDFRTLDFLVLLGQDKINASNFITENNAYNTSDILPETDSKLDTQSKVYYFNTDQTKQHTFDYSFVLKDDVNFDIRQLYFATKSDKIIVFNIHIGYYINYNLLYLLLNNPATTNLINYIIPHNLEHNVLYNLFGKGSELLNHLINFYPSLKEIINNITAQPNISITFNIPPIEDSKLSVELRTEHYINNIDPNSNNYNKSIPRLINTIHIINDLNNISQITGLKFKLNFLHSNYTPINNIQWVY